MQNQTLITNTTPEELVESITSKVNSLIKESKQPKLTHDYLTRDEVCKLLKIDLSTLWHWTKKNKLKAHGIGGRIYYIREEIEQAIKPLNK